MSPHAVRWARRAVRNEMEYTGWHWTNDAQFTACGRPIPLGLDGTFVPETDDAPERVTCRQCQKPAVPPCDCDERRVLAARRGQGERRVGRGAGAMTYLAAIHRRLQLHYVARTRCCGRVLTWSLLCRLMRAATAEYAEQG
jgi:hypothetical protein